MASGYASTAGPIRRRGWLVIGCLLVNGLCMNLLSAAPIDEFRISDLEQKVRELESASREQARIISQLQGQPGISRSTSPLPSVGNPNRSSPWLVAANWQRLKPGMSELQVVEILGPPSQIKLNDQQSRSMMYALEIGRSGFLVGKVDLHDNQITTIDIPRLK